VAGADSVIYELDGATPPPILGGGRGVVQRFTGAAFGIELQAESHIKSLF